jgi:hypothetical protein
MRSAMNVADGTIPSINAAIRLAYRGGKRLNPYPVIEMPIAPKHEMRWLV